MVDSEFWRGRRVLVTGHTGFKGAWLSLWLERMGARVSGFSLAAESARDLYNHIGVQFEHEVIGDLRQADLVEKSLRAISPEIVFHLAAQSLVRRSYASPCETFAVNVMGTAHLLQAARTMSSVRTILVITTDKVYENLERGQPFVESDALGGHDPYSASKACTEILVASFRKSFFANRGSPVLGTARAGNVIGGGDWAEDRIVPDIVRALESKQPVRLRYPAAVRPWQHVLEPLAGYLLMAQAMSGSAPVQADALNFGPRHESERSVADLVDAFSARFGGRPGWIPEAAPQPRESGLLNLSAEKAGSVLGWRPLLNFEETIGWTADWYNEFARSADIRNLTLEQILAYESRIKNASHAGRADERLVSR